MDFLENMRKSLDAMNGATATNQNYKTASDKKYVPDNVQRRIDTLFEKIDSAYPNGVISGLYNDHKKWAETALDIARTLGYDGVKDFFEAYGYTYENKAMGRPKNDNDELIAELKKRYVNGPTCTTIRDLYAENPDLSSRLESFRTNQKDFNGMTFAKYLVSEGLLIEKNTTNVYLEELSKLKQRYTTPFNGTVTDLQYLNPDINWNQIKINSSSSMLKLLEDEGIIAKKHSRVVLEHDKEYFDNIIDALKLDSESNGIVYAESKAVAEYFKTKGEISYSDLEILCNKYYGKKLALHLVDIGVLSIYAKEVSNEVRLECVINELSERYINRKNKRYFITDLERDNPDLPIKSMKAWIKSIHDSEPLDYLIKVGILVPQPINQYYDTTEYDDIEANKNENSQIDHSVYKKFADNRYMHIDEIDKSYYSDIISLTDTVKALTKKAITVVDGKNTFNVVYDAKRYLNYAAEYCNARAADPFTITDYYYNSDIKVDESSGMLINAPYGYIPDSIKPIKDSIAVHRSFVFVEVAKKCYDDKMIEELLKLFPKKKDGTLNRGRVLRIVSCFKVTFDGEYYELIATPVDDTTLKITGRHVGFNMNSVRNICDDVFATTDLFV